MRELRRVGLSRVWLDVAQLGGPSRFLEVWRKLDREELIEQEGRLRLTIPRFRLYLRYQRNRYIEELTRAGYGATEIRERVQTELGETISLAHVWRLMRGPPG